MAAVAPQPAMTTIQLQVPPDGQPGQLIQAQINGQTIQAQVPPGLQPGATFSVQVPTGETNDPAATAAYDALLAGASRLSFSSKYGHGANGPYDKGPWSVETDTGAAFHGAQFVRPGQNCCKTADPWLELGATPVAARRDLVAAVVALKCTDTAAYFQPQGGY